MAGVPTFTTLQDIANISVQFRNDTVNSWSSIEDRMRRVNRYIKIQDPAFPGDETKRIWHPNMTAFYSPEQLAIIQQMCDQFQQEYDFWHDFVVTNAATTESLFDVTPKLDALVTAGLSQLMQG